MYNPLTPLRFLERAAAVHPDRTAIIDGPRSFTYREMTEQVTRLAQAFTAKGLQPGDRVAYLAPNCAEELVAQFAVPMAGGVLVTLNTRLSPAEIAHIVETVRRYLRAGSVDTLLAGGVRASVLDSFRPYLHDRLADGERNATRVARRDRRAGLHRRL